MLDFIGKRRLIELTEKEENQQFSGSLPGKLEQSGFPRTLVPLYTWPSLSLHQQNPDEGWHCTSSYLPSVVHSGAKSRGTAISCQPKANWRSRRQRGNLPIKETTTLIKTEPAVMKASWWTVQKLNDFSRRPPQVISWRKTPNFESCLRKSINDHIIWFYWLINALQNNNNHINLPSW